MPRDQKPRFLYRKGTPAPTPPEGWHIKEANRTAKNGLVMMRSAPYGYIIRSFQHEGGLAYIEHTDAEALKRANWIAEKLGGWIDP